MDRINGHAHPDGRGGLKIAADAMAELIAPPPDAREYCLVYNASGIPGAVAAVMLWADSDSLAEAEAARNMPDGAAWRLFALESAAMVSRGIGSQVGE